MVTIPYGQSLVHAARLVETEHSFELDIVITQCLVLVDGIAQPSAPVTTPAPATCDHARFTGTFLSGPNFRAVVKPAGLESEFVIDVAQTPNLVMVVIIVLS